MVIIAVSLMLQMRLCDVSFPSTSNTVESSRSSQKGVWLIVGTSFWLSSCLTAGFKGPVWDLVACNACSANVDQCFLLSLCSSCDKITKPREDSMLWASEDTQWGTMDSSPIVKPAIYAGLMLIGNKWIFLSLYQTKNIQCVFHFTPGCPFKCPSNVLKTGQFFFTKYDFLTFTP